MRPAGFAQAVERSRRGVRPVNVLERAIRAGPHLLYTPRICCGALEDHVATGRVARALVTRDAVVATALRGGHVGYALTVTTAAGDAEGADGPVPYVAWYLNKLQGFESATDYVVTLDYAGEIAPEHVIADHRVQHPIIDLPLRQLQREIHRLTTSDRVALAGSYFHSSDLGWDVIGSHEAGFTSGTRAARTLLAARAAAAPAAAPSDAVPA